MLERLLDLLLHAKAGAVATVFVVGATGALVTATVSNGVTTITITQASASPSASPSPTGTATTALRSPSPSPSTSLSSSLSSSSAQAQVSGNCSEQAHAINEAVQTVDRAFSHFHNDLEKLGKSARTESARTILKTADSDLKGIRQDAVKAIHDTKTCNGEDEDEDNDEDNDDDDDDLTSTARALPGSGEESGLLTLLRRVFGSNVTVATAPATTNTTSSTNTSTTDPMAIAEKAVADMQAVFDKAKADLTTANATTATPRTQRTAKPTDNHRRDGKSQSQEREHEEDDD